MILRSVTRFKLLMPSNLYPNIYSRKDIDLFHLMLSLFLPIRSSHGLLPTWPCSSVSRASDQYTEGRGLESQPWSSRVFLDLSGMRSFTWSSANIYPCFLPKNIMTQLLRYRLLSIMYRYFVKAKVGLDWALTPKMANQITAAVLKNSNGLLFKLRA